MRPMRPERTHETQETQKTHETQKSHETHETQETQKTHATQHYKLIIYQVFLIRRATCTSLLLLLDLRQCGIPVDDLITILDKEVNALLIVRSHVFGIYLLTDGDKNRSTKSICKHLAKSM